MESSGNTRSLPRVVIAGATSGVGKTTLTAGLIAALAARGHRVQPFKCGPDYIDPGYHTLAAGRPCRNLDSWLLPPAALAELFAQATNEADLAIIEGVMGLYDGRDTSEAGSTAELAKLLNAPIILTLDAGKTSRSAAALVLGYQQFDSGVRIGGIILNHIAGPSHYRLVREPIEQRTGIPVLGYLPKTGIAPIPERHLGLVTAAEGTGLAEAIAAIAAQVSQTVDLEGVLALAQGAGPFPWRVEATGTLFPALAQPVRARIAIAQDAAFSFYYQDSLDLLRAWGAELLPCSPLDDTRIPPKAQGFYIGGGFPELYAARLAANVPFVESLSRAAAAGMPIYAECGGLMYLCEGIIDFEGVRHRLASLLPGWSVMQSRRVRIGYATAIAHQDSILLLAGQVVRGHEFHWSDIDAPSSRCAAYMIEQPSSLSQQEVRYEGLIGGPQNNILGSYLHLHFGSAPTAGQRFLAHCAAWEAGRPAHVHAVDR